MTRTIRRFHSFLSVPMPVVMMTRCIVVAGAAAAKQRTHDNKQSEPALHPNSHHLVLNEPLAGKMVSQFFLRNRIARPAVQTKSDGYDLERLVRNAGVGAVAAPRMAPRADPSPLFR
jgi:hypothetical protein